MAQWPTKLPTGFRPLPGTFFLALAGIVVACLVLAETGKYWFYRFYRAPAAPAPKRRTPGYRAPPRRPLRHVHPHRPAHTPTPGTADRTTAYAGRHHRGGSAVASRTFALWSRSCDAAQ